MMLRLIAPKLSDGEIIKFVKRKLPNTVYEVDDGEAEQVMDLDEEVKFDLFSDWKALPVFKKLKSDFDQTVVLAAFVSNEEVLNDDTKKAELEDIFTSWCMDHEDEVDECKTMIKDYEKKISNTSCADDSANMSNVFATFDDGGSLPLIEKLELVWSNFLNSVNQLDIEDFVSFHIVADILKELSSQHQLLADREMLDILVQGKPNLIVCPSSDTYATCLTLYAHGNSAHFPTVDEVLLCTKETSLEQLELICRRAFHDQSGKIYCIVHAENIDYDKSIHLERLIELTTVTQHHYRLVFIAGKESIDGSYITIALEQFKRSAFEFMNAEKLRKFAFDGLQSSKQRLDLDGCRGRLVVSSLAGNGKSLVVRNLTSALDDDQKSSTQIDKRHIDYRHLLSRFFEHEKRGFFHIDFASRETEMKEDLVFALFILGGLTNPTDGGLWLCRPQDYLIVEITLPKNVTEAQRKPLTLFDILPKVECLAPRECLDLLTKDPGNAGLISERLGCYLMGFDPAKYASNQYQRPYKRLYHVSV